MTRNKIKKLKEKYNLSQLECDLIRFEGLRLKPYKCTKGKWTVGVGRNLEDNPLRLCEIISLLECDTKEKKEGFFINLLNTDVITLKINTPTYFTRKLKHDKVRLDILLNMSYQMGFNSVKGFIEMFKAIRAKDWKKASIEMLDSKWAKQTPNRARVLAERMRTGKMERSGQY